MSMLVKDGDKCIGYHVVDKIERENFDIYFSNGTHMEKPYLDFKDNYAEGLLIFWITVVFIYSMLYFYRYQKWSICIRKS